MDLRICSPHKPPFLTKVPSPNRPFTLLFTLLTLTFLLTRYLTSVKWDCGNMQWPEILLSSLGRHKNIDLIHVVELDSGCKFLLSIDTGPFFVMMYVLFMNKLCTEASIMPLPFVLQLLLVQDGKLYGRDTFLTICARSLAIDVSKNHGLHLNEYIIQLNQVKTDFL